MIRPMEAADKDTVLEMMQIFYASPAVLSNGSEEIFRSDVEECLGDSPYLEGYIFEADGEIQGYAMAAKSFSTEFGKRCVWIEDLYVKPECRGLGLGGALLAYLTEKYPDCILRLEVEEENEGAMRLYQRSGFRVIPYTEMIK